MSVLQLWRRARAFLSINQPHHRSIGRRRHTTGRRRHTHASSSRISLSSLSRAHVPADAAANNASRRDVVVNCSLPIDALAVVVAAARRWWRRGAGAVVVAIIVIVIVIVVIVVIVVSRERDRRQSVR